MMCNSLIYDGIDFGSYGKIENIDRPLLPQINLTTRDIAGRDGSLYGGSTLDPLTITIQLRVFDYISLDSLLNELAGRLYKKELRPLNFNLKQTWYDAVLANLSYNDRFRSQRALVAITFYIPYPLARSKYRIETEPYTEKEFKLNGNQPTKAIFKFNADEIKITNMRTGQNLQILEGDTFDFIIDCEHENVRSKDLNLMKRLSWNSRFFEIADGDVIKSTKPITASYYERYLHDVTGW